MGTSWGNVKSIKGQAQLIKGLGREVEWERVETLKKRAEKVEKGRS